MNEFKGTKGEWKANYVNAAEFEIVSNHYPSAGLLQLANVRNGSDYGTVEEKHIEAEANAKLIAAAPELLNALQERVEDFWNGFKDSPNENALKDNFRNTYPNHPICLCEAAIKKATLFILLLIGLSATAQTPKYKVTGWHYEAGITCMQVQLSFGKWCVFKIEGNHISDDSLLLHSGCILTHKSADLMFPLCEDAYVTLKDEAQIKSSLNLKTLCNEK